MEFPFYNYTLLDMIRDLIRDIVIHDLQSLQSEGQQVSTEIFGNVCFNGKISGNVYLEKTCFLEMMIHGRISS